MTNAVEDSQKQDPGSALIVLYELEYETGSTLYFSPSGLKETVVDEIQFRDSSGNPQTYIPFPIEVEGFDISTDGSYSRPVVTIANIENTLKTAINNDFESLIGKRITRRTTYQRYLVGEAGDSGLGNAPVELPKQVYIIDRIKSKNVLQVEFELATPFDLAGIELPRRVIIGGACSFKYKGASTDKLFSQREGGCSWNAKFVKGSSNLFMTRNDEYILPSTFTYTLWSGGTSVPGDYYKTEETTPEGFYKVTSTGVLQAANRVNYWQAIRAVTTAPSDSDKRNWRRVRVYQTTYTDTSEYCAYKDQNFSDYVLNNNELWRVKITQDSGSPSTHQPLQEGPYWTAGDVCGKTLKSCRLRFYAKETSSGTLSVSVSTGKSSTGLPFGGFPGATQRR